MQFNLQIITDGDAFSRIRFIQAELTDRSSNTDAFGKIQGYPNVSQVYTDYEAGH